MKNANGFVRKLQATFAQIGDIEERSRKICLQFSTQEEAIWLINGFMIIKSSLGYHDYKHMILLDHNQPLFFNVHVGVNLEIGNQQGVFGWLVENHVILTDIEHDVGPELLKDRDIHIIRIKICPKKTFFAKLWNRLRALGN